jgi:NH3-dependent NAD+ synthetase
MSCAVSHTRLPYRCRLRDVVEAPPTAELRPITEAYTQTDEEDMGMSYAELADFGRLRKVERCGPVSMFQQLFPRWSASLEDGGRALSAAEVSHS